MNYSKTQEGWNKMNVFLQAIKYIVDHSREYKHTSFFFIAIILFFVFQPVIVAHMDSGEILIQENQKHYSLWLVPGGEKREFYQNLIKELGRKHNGPVFVPHITVIGNIPMTEEEVLLRAPRLAALLHPLSVTLNEVSTGDVFYRCVFAKAEKSQSLIELYIQACKTFDITPVEFMPHLSILYGDYDMSLKKKIAAEIEIQDVLYLDSLYIYETSPYLEPQDWCFVAKIPFH